MENKLEKIKRKKKKQSSWWCNWCGRKILNIWRPKTRKSRTKKLTHRILSLRKGLKIVIHKAMGFRQEY